jgi:hypothetical protein
MATAGPLTRYTKSLALGLCQVRVGKSIDNIANKNPVLTSSNSLGAMAKTTVTVTKEIFKHESGFPSMRDKNIPLKEYAMLEIESEEITPYNIAVGLGIAAMSGEWAALYANPYSGEVAIGRMQAPEDVRVEAVYTYPDAETCMVYIFPRAQAGESMTIDHQQADTAKPAMKFEAQRADSEVSGGNAAWNSMQLGRIFWTPKTTIDNLG